MPTGHGNLDSNLETFCIFWNVTPCNPVELTIFLEEPIASNFEVVELTKKVTSKKQRECTASHVSTVLFYPENGGWRHRSEIPMSNIYTKLLEMAKLYRCL